MARSPSDDLTSTRTDTVGSRPRSRFRSLSDPESLRALVHNVGEGIYIATRDGRLLDANPAFLRMLGLESLDQFHSMRTGDLLLDPDRREAEIAAIDRDGAVREFELTIRRPDGEIVTALDTCYVAVDPDTGERFYHGILVDITTRKALEEQLLHMSIHDALTGCLNRRVLAEVEEAFDREPTEPWGCIFVDIDHFKRYNDDFGHQAGDDVLVRMARFLMRHVRAQESVLRFGGDEFIVMLRGADARRTRRVVQRLRTTALKSAPVPFSVGCAARRKGETLNQLLDRADRKLMAVRVMDRGGEARRETDT